MSRAERRAGAALRILARAAGVLLALGGAAAEAQPSDSDTPDTPEATAAADAPSLFRSPEDGWLDVSGFLAEKYGFLPIVAPITEPAVGYGAAVGLTFLSKPLAQAEDGLGRPDITFVGGLGTENGTWGAFAGDVRYWLDDRVQTQVSLIYASANLDFYGLGDRPELADDPLRYELEPKGGTVQVEYRLGDSRVWVGASYTFSATDVRFDEPDAPGVPELDSASNVGGLTPSVTYDTRENFFTPGRGTYLEASGGFFSQAFGSDDEFQRAGLIAMQFVPLGSQLFVGVRADAAASFGDEPFYLRPYISLRGAQALRYQGEEVLQAEAELRWQFWKRLSAVGFVGGGGAWNDFERFDRSQAIVTGGTGLRYELARAHGIHMGLDVAFGPDEPAIYVQFGSAWARP